MFGKFRARKSANEQHEAVFTVISENIYPEFTASGRPVALAAGHANGFGETPTNDAITPEPSEQPVSAEATARLIRLAEEFMAVPQDDLAYAVGKMDTTRAENWLVDAESLLERAEEALIGGRYEEALAYVAAARALAGTADMLLAQTLGLANLPGHQRYGVAPEEAAEHESPNREGVRRELLSTNISIATRRSVPRPSGAARYLNQAETAYKTAYEAYIDGNYEAARDGGWLAQGLIRAVDALSRVNNAPHLPGPPASGIEAV